MYITPLWAKFRNTQILEHDGRYCIRKGWAYYNYIARDGKYWIDNEYICEYHFGSIQEVGEMWDKVVLKLVDANIELPKRIYIERK